MKFPPRSETLPEPPSAARAASARSRGPASAPAHCPPEPTKTSAAITPPSLPPWHRVPLPSASVPALSRPPATPRPERPTNPPAPPPAIAPASPEPTAPAPSAPPSPARSNQTTPAANSNPVSLDPFESALSCHTKDWIWTFLRFCRLKSNFHAGTSPYPASRPLPPAES